MLDARNVRMDDAKTFQKVALVRAVRVHEPFFVSTREGTMTAKAGDYLCEGVDGERWPIRADIFARTYREVVACEGCGTTSEVGTDGGGRRICQACVGC